MGGKAIEVLRLALSSASGAFLQVGVFVGGMLLVFGLLNYKTMGRFVSGLEHAKRWQPLFGALLGVSPGCGGAIFVMPLFVRKAVTFGTVVATLIATAGDSAFVLISAAPSYAAVCYAISFAVAVASGYLVDAVPVWGFLRRGMEKETFEDLVRRHAAAEAATPDNPPNSGRVILSRDLVHIGHSEGDTIDMALHHSQPPLDPSTWRYTVTHYASPAYWAIVSLGLLLGVAILFQVDVDSQMGIPYLGTVVGVTGTAISILVMIASRTFYVSDTPEQQEHKLFSLKETLIHSAGETAFATTWVFVAYFSYELLIFLIGRGDHAAGQELAQIVMRSAGVMAVVVGALVGLIPGCGPQIIFVSLFVRGLLPFSALLAHAISQDGDALFPLIAMDRKSALWATLVTTIPALIVGLAWYIMGLDKWLLSWLPRLS